MVLVSKILVGYIIYLIYFILFSNKSGPMCKHGKQLVEHLFEQAHLTPERKRNLLTALFIFLKTKSHLIHRYKQGIS